MNFIERWLGVSPDGGDGTLEAAWVAAIVITALAVAFRRRIRRWLSERRGHQR